VENIPTVTREAGEEIDVIQRTDDGDSRDVTRTTPDGATHTGAVDFSCDKDAAKCVEQVEVGRALTF
jgi:hypothetical protein